MGDYQKFAPRIALPKASILSVALLKKCLPFLFDERDFVSYGEVRRYIFVKGNCIFIYGDKSDPRPLYVIELHKFRAKIEDPSKPDKRSHTVSPQAGSNMPASYFTTVLLEEK